MCHGRFVRQCRMAVIPRPVALLPDEPRAELSTERVRSGRRAAIVVAGLAVVVVGTLVWKPWDSAAPAATRRPTLPAVALASPSAGPSPVITPVPATPVPTTDASQQVIAAPDNLGSIRFYPNEGPAGWCIYKAANRKAPLTLSVIVVEPPVVIVGDSAGDTLRAVRWHIELETNTQDKLFESEWLHSSESEAKMIDVGQFGFVKPISIAVPAAHSITVFRAPMVIEWLGHGATVLATQRVVPAAYGMLGAPGWAPQPGGCPATI